MSSLPFLKWAGGKRWLVNAHSYLFNVDFNGYIEPFLGGGAVFFYLMPKTAILADKNPALINAYRAIKEDWRAVFNELVMHSTKHSAKYYYEIRSINYDNIFSKAAQFIYLNRTCWNGLYRVNLRGFFNVPKGTKDKVLLDTDNFEETAMLLQDVELYNLDFETIIDGAGLGDLVFVDPPYTANHNNNGFLKYNQHIFSWSDQIRLSECVIRAKRRGAQIILTNADHRSISELYKKDFKIRPIYRASVLAGNPEYRGQVSELLVTG